MFDHGKGEVHRQFSSIKLGQFQKHEATSSTSTPPRWDTGPSQGLYSWVERGSA